MIKYERTADQADHCPGQRWVKQSAVRDSAKLKLSAVQDRVDS